MIHSYLYNDDYQTEELNKFFPEMYSYSLSSQGLAVIFSHHQVCIKKNKGGHFYLGGGGAKVKVEFRHLFSLKKRFSLCSADKINANIDVFC